jgi:enoyl-[acyl-carrier protein] reductase II
MNLDKLNKLWVRGQEFLGTEYAILGGAMSWVSEHNLVAAISNAGAFGVIACGSMTPELLDNEIKKTKEKTNKPFGVNLITMHPDLDKLVDTCKDNEVSHVVLAGGLPRSATIKKIHDFGAKVICFAPAVPIAKRLVKSGADALIVEGMEAGGHIGPVATSVLAQEILPVMKNVIPIFIAGGIGRGEAIASYLEMGAVGCQLGTKFVCATESIAHPNFKKAFIRGNSRNAVASIQIDSEFPVIPVRALENKASKHFMEYQQGAINKYKSGELGKEEAQLDIEHFWAGALRKAVIDGDVENGSLMAGQSVCFVNKEEPATDIINELLVQAEQFLDGK